MIEYSVRPVTRYFVTRYHSDGSEGGVETKGEYENPNVAHEVAYALCKAEHDVAGTPLGDPNFVYPKPINSITKCDVLETANGVCEKP